MYLNFDLQKFLFFPILLFIGILLFWFLQSLILLYVTRKFIFPYLYKNRLTEWFIVEFAIAIHELSHFFAALFTGSEINLKESFITSKAGRISAKSSHSIGGWISIVIAAFAPAFLPSILLFVVSILLFQVNIPMNKIFSANTDLDFESYIEILISVLYPVFDLLISLIFSPTLLSILLIYFIMVSSLTSTPSEDDWRASFYVLLSFPMIPLLILFILLNFVSYQFNFNLFLFVIFVLSITLIYISFGILFNLAFILILQISEKIWAIVARFLRKLLNINE